MTEQEQSILEMRDELIQLLRAWAGGLRPDREAAGRYMSCRTALLVAKVPVPGFVIQCSSIYKFTDFISLYDPRLAARLQFLDTMFGVRQASPKAAYVRDIFQDFDQQA